MREKITILLLSLISTIDFGQSVNFQWAKTFSGKNDDRGKSIVVDGSGNVYSTGIFSDTTDFDPGIGVYNLVSTGKYDVFISKLDASGSFLWAKAVGGVGQDNGNSIALDPSGDVYITGSFDTIADFDPGITSYTISPQGVQDIFILKINSSGSFIWAQSMEGGFNSSAAGNSINFDGMGNIYLAGTFNNSVDFDPGPGTFPLNSTGICDVFICKLNSTGNFIWAKNFDGSGSGAGCASMAVDGLGNVYTTGYFNNTVDFDPGPSTYTISSIFATNDIYISKLDAAGNFVWAKKMGGNSTDEGYSIAVDMTGNVYSTGYYTGTADFDPGPSVYNLPGSSGFTNIYVNKLDNLGNFVWAKAFTATNTYKFGYAISLDALGDVYTTGTFDGITDFDPGPSTYTLSSNFSSDVYISKLTSSGSFVWAKGLHGNQGAFGNSIIVDASGNVYSTGHFFGTVDFDPNVGVTNITSTSYGVYIHKMSQPGTGIESIPEETKSLRIYPNPCNGIFIVQNETEDGEIILLNSLGQLIRQQKIKKGLNEIDIDNFIDGIYFYTLRQNKTEKERGKLIKQN